MSLITHVSAIQNGHQATVDLSTNTLGVGNLEVAGTSISQVGTPALFSGTISGTATPVSIVANWSGTAGNSIALVFNGTDTITMAIAAWNGLHPTNAASLTSGNGAQVPTSQTVHLSGGVNAGSSAVADTATYVNFTPTAATVAGALAGIDIALASAAGTSPKVDKFTLDSTDITNKFVTLTTPPSTPGETILLVEDAGNMFYGSDFDVVGSQLSWNGLALDGILSVGDNLTASYST